MNYGAPVLGAHVSGIAAHVIVALLDERMPARLVALQRLASQGRIPEARVAEVASTWAAIREAARHWNDSRNDSLAAVDGSAADPAAAMPEPSQEIDTDRAAGLLGVTPNRVRQLARSGDLPGRKAGGVWLVDRAAVDDRRSVNSGSFR